MEFLLLLVLLLVIVAVGGRYRLLALPVLADHRGGRRWHPRFSTLSERLLPDTALAIDRWPWCDLVETARDN